MTDDQKIIQDIGKILWGIFPEGADKIVFEGMFYPDSHQCGPKWYDKDGTRLGPQIFDDRLEAANDEMAELVIRLQSVPPFAKSPFTQMRYEVTNEMKIQVRFAYIPEWDSWPSLYMKGVSDVPEEEAEKRKRFYEEWQKCRARREKEPYNIEAV